MVKNELIWQEERCHHEDVSLSVCMEQPCSLRDLFHCSRSRTSLLQDRRTEDVPGFLRIATNLDPAGLCAAPLGDRLGPVIPRANALLRAMSHHEGEIAVGRALAALVPRSRFEVTGVERDSSPWVRALSTVATASVFQLERATVDPCHMVRLAIVLNPLSPQRVLERLAGDACPQVVRVARNILDRDGLRAIEPTALLLRSDRCDCEDDCTTAPVPRVSVTSVDVSESALDLLFRLAEMSSSVGSIRPTGCGSGAGWAFGVCSGTYSDPEDLLLLVDPEARISLPDSEEWHEFSVDEAVSWVAERTRIRVTSPVTTLRLGILIGDDAVRSPLAVTIRRIGHLVASEEVAARLQPFRVEGVPFEPSDPAHGVGATADWVLEVARRRQAHRTASPGYQVQKALIDLRSGHEELASFSAAIMDAMDKDYGADRHKPLSAQSWRENSLPMRIPRNASTPAISGEDGVAIESVLDASRVCLAGGAWMAVESDLSESPVAADDSFQAACTFRRHDDDVMMFAVNGEELDAVLGIGGRTDGELGQSGWHVPLDGMPIEVAGVGTFLRTAGGWFLVREIDGADGRWLSGYGQAMSTSSVRGLAEFKDMLSDVHVPEPSDRNLRGTAHELASFLGNPEEPFVTGFRYELAIDGVVDAEYRGWEWTRCDGDWTADCTGSSESVHGCSWPSDGETRHVVQPWAFPDVVRIWDGSGQVPTVLAMVAARSSRDRVSRADLGAADITLMEDLLGAAASAGDEISDAKPVRELLSGFSTVCAQDLLQSLVRLLDGRLASG
jgi:hypothetical protein